MVLSFETINNSLKLIIMSFVLSFYKKHFLKQKIIKCYYLISNNELIKFDWLLDLLIIWSAKLFLIVSWLNTLFMT